MTSLPVHPMVVHLPLVLMLLVPVAALLAAWRIRRGASAAGAWLPAATLALAVTASAFVAVRTGEAEEEKVEDLVAERVLHAHESAAERFLMLSAALSVVTLAGFARGSAGKAARMLSTAGAFGLIATGVQVGRAGGELVYREGAANAYVNAQEALNDHAEAAAIPRGGLQANSESVHKPKSNRTEAEEVDK